jgi:Xaa-Pro aminopeptidase
MNNLNKLKNLLIEKNIDAYLVPKNDCFFNEFTKTGNDRLRYVSNFTGSAGTALIFKKKKLSFCRWKIHSSGKARDRSSF